MTLPWLRITGDVASVDVPGSLMNAWGQNPYVEPNATFEVLVELDGGKPTRVVLQAPPPAYLPEGLRAVIVAAVQRAMSPEVED